MKLYEANSANFLPISQYPAVQTLAIGWGSSHQEKVAKVKRSPVNRNSESYSAKVIEVNAKGLKVTELLSKESLLQVLAVCLVIMETGISP